MKKMLFMILIVSFFTMQLRGASQLIEIAGEKEKKLIVKPRKKSKFQKFYEKNKKQTQKLVTTIKASYTGPMQNVFEHVQFSAPLASKKEYKRSRSRELKLYASLVEQPEAVTQRPCKKAKIELQQQCGAKINSAELKQALVSIHSLSFDFLELVKQHIENIKYNTCDFNPQLINKVQYHFVQTILFAVQDLCFLSTQGVALIKNLEHIA